MPRSSLIIQADPVHIDTPANDHVPGAAPLLAARRLLTRETVGDSGRTLHQIDDGKWESFYRDRWSYDRVVRSTHGVNCTGSCSWNVFVKDDLITWEHQATDYPTVGPDAPDYEPRGCPRGASFSWYEYSPSRVRHPYVRGVLLEMYRAALEHTGDPVLAWADVVETPLKARAYKSARGRGGFVRAGWDEITTMVAAAHVYTTRRWGPDRVIGFSPIPAMSMASFAAGTRYHALIGGTLLSFYDWYADLPVASPQIWGDQTDVPESGDWWNSTYLVMWGSNIPVTRTPDAHFLTEARYRGTKVVAVSPDYADNVKFADDWLAPHPGTDGALAMAMGHVVLTEFFRDRKVPYFTDYARRFTDLPFLVTLRPLGDGAYTPDRFLTAADLGAEDRGATHRTVLLDERDGTLAVPHGTLGDRWGEDGMGRWNLDLDGIEPALGVLGPPRRRRRDRPAALRRRRHRGRRDRPARRAGAAPRRHAGHRRVRPAAGPLRRRPGRAAGRVAGRLRRRGEPAHAGLAGGDHRRAGRAGRPHRPRVRP